MKKVFLDDLPKGAGKGLNINKLVINWKECVGYKIRFIYDDIEGWLEIINYYKKEQKVIIKYNDKEFEIHTGGLQRCQLGNLLGKYTSDFKIKTGARLKDEKRDITIIDRELIPRYDESGNLKSYDKWYKYKCNKCGFDCSDHFKNGEYKEEMWILEGALLTQGQGCSCCHGLVTVKGINDIPTNAPWLISYFQGGIDEAKLYTKNGGYKIYPICPDCKNIKNKKMRICDIYSRKSIGCTCSDGIKYPNKFAFKILEELGVNFETEYSPNWIKPKAYDFYFKLNNKEYILEMDGGLGHGKKDNKMSGQTKEESKSIDDEKDRLAKLHNIEVIRIDCDYKNYDRFKYIKQNILDDKGLNKLFDLSIIDWNKCEEFALSNRVKEACEYKYNNPDMSTTEIGILMNLHTKTILKYLKQGTKIWDWAKYNSKTEKIKSLRKRVYTRKKILAMFKDGLFLNIFDSAVYLDRVSEDLFGVKLYKSKIGYVCRGGQEKYKGYDFKYIEDLTPLEYIKYDIENKLKELHNQELVQAV